MKYRSIALAGILLSPLASLDASDLPAAFNGHDFSGWKVPEGNIWWSVDNETIHLKNGPDKKGSTLWTKRAYQNFIMEFEFQLGEGRVDTGIFIRTDKEQIQIGESGSLKRDMTGSPYIAGKGYPQEAKGVKELLDLKGWNQMTIVAIGNNYTIFLNGQHVNSYNSDSSVTSGPIGIQLHGNREMSASYRRIHIGELD